MEEKEFDRLLKTCRIKLTKEEYDKIKNDIESIISYFNSIDNTQCQENPAYHPINIKENLGEDVPKKFDNVEGILKNTRTYRFYIVGPKI